MKKLALLSLSGLVMLGALPLTAQSGPANTPASREQAINANQGADHTYFATLRNLFSASTPKETIEGVTELIENSKQSSQDSTIDKGIGFVTLQLNKIIVNYVSATIDFNEVPQATREKFVKVAKELGFLSDDESELILKGNNPKEKQKLASQDVKESDGIVSKYFTTVKSLATASAGVDTLKEATDLLEESNKLKSDSVVDQGIKTAVNQFNKITIGYINSNTDFESIPKEVREKYAKEALKAGLVNDDEAKSIIEY